MSGQQGGESPSGTMITDYTNPPIMDQYGNSWALSRSQQVMIDGVVDRTTYGVTLLMYINRTMWQWVEGKRLWWGKTSPLAPWSPPTGTPNAPIGPAPDPRIDQILTALGSLAQSDGAAFGMAAAQVAQVQATLDALPPPEPDPRIAALIGAVGRNFAAVRGMLATIEERADAEVSLNADRWAGLTDQLDTIDAALHTNAEAVAAVGDQVDRVIKMMLDLFPGQLKPRIVIGGPTFTSQPAPTSSGP
jgi:hypothetical protein